MALGPTLGLRGLGGVGVGLFGIEGGFRGAAVGTAAAVSSSPPAALAEARGPPRGAGGGRTVAAVP